ncbi:LysM domain-containing protein [Filimonas lacunae]|uniref:LysM domain-containing protein n=2 Tax=Filimonas lacunae TaxID=477680 RepID=A0A173MGJ1_9BACT|nr:hypothetical protein FLA_2619 [Filimonas lacunae]SIT27536.1 LysM domain-containing protein [Filimonas lacunae]
MDQLQALLQGANRPVNSLPVTSRYYNVGNSTIEDENGRNIIYLRRRFIQAPEKYTVLQEYTVKEGDRLDNIAASFIGDATQFWQLADANNVMKPEEMAVAGNKINITQPAGSAGF